MGIQDLQWVKNRLKGISMRLTENYKFGKTHFSLESVRTEIIQKRGIVFHDDENLILLLIFDGKI